MFVIWRFLPWHKISFEQNMTKQQWPIPFLSKSIPFSIWWELMWGWMEELGGRGEAIRKSQGKIEGGRPLDGGNWKDGNQTRWKGNWRKERDFGAKGIWQKHWVKGGLNLGIGAKWMGKIYFGGGKMERKKWVDEIDDNDNCGRWGNVLEGKA
jgi:hypothetical protein